MKRPMLVLCLALSVAAAATRLLHTTHVQAAGITGRPCSTFIPKEWGEFRGASTYGMEFEDSDGTIRFVKNPPCDPSFNVRADLEIHRKK